VIPTDPAEVETPGAVPPATPDSPGRRWPGKPVFVLLAAAVLLSGLFAFAAWRARNQNAQSSEIRATGIPARVSTPMANLMSLSPVPTRIAPDFSLVDQDGRAFSLSSFRGKSVVLEFMDPHCTDICPIISQEFVDAYHDLRSYRSKVVFVAVNVNPYHLAVRDMATFTEEHELNTVPSWHFLTGPVNDLRTVWTDYGVSVDAPSPSADVIHSSFVYFIDPNGHERYLGSPEDDHTAKGDAYLPANQIASWGQGIAMVARSMST